MTEALQTSPLSLTCNLDWHLANSGYCFENVSIKQSKKADLTSCDQFSMVQNMFCDNNFLLKFSCRLSSIFVYKYSNECCPKILSILIFCNYVQRLDIMLAFSFLVNFTSILIPRNWFWFLSKIPCSLKAAFVQVKTPFIIRQNCLRYHKTLPS